MESGQMLSQLYQELPQLDGMLTVERVIYKQAENKIYFSFLSQVLVTEKIFLRMEHMIRGMYPGTRLAIRVSLTGSPLPEADAAWDILRALGLRNPGIEIISCPTCGRTCIPVADIAKRVQEELSDITVPMKVAVMGCVVNGPGEAREADIGIAGGDGWGMIFEKGEQVDKLPYDELLPALLRRIENL